MSRSVVIRRANRAHNCRTVELVCRLIYEIKRLFIHEGGIDNRGSGVWNRVKGVTQLVLVVVHAGYDVIGRSV